MSVPRFWREIPKRYNLIGTRCENCNTVFFPPRYVCPKCRRVGKLEPYKLKGRGKIISFNITHSPPAGFETQTPYVMAIMELEEGPRITTPITDCNLNDIKIGDKVETVFRRLGQDGEDGVLYYGFKFRPLGLKEI